MKIRIEVDENLIEEEVVIRCSRLNTDIQKIQQAVSDITSKAQRFVFYKGDTEYYLLLEEILFFETEANGICVHTLDNVYQTKYKLYELEELLPGFFMRVSKSAILNVNQIYSISRNLTASSIVQFQNTHKQVYVSRYYYKLLKQKLEEKRMSV
ncbi:LytTR family transcriptional regulator [Lachnotalea glycerini]|uniref:LytTR family transcriptional regulator n=1 Tax=Lachnotalea glycerini TaxID=1763509 RepID=A0A255IDC1_9FIRM|nr:LytTR family DNA-binding domain-containing protein [Lachnotalea glycerini]PXV90304.1 LytTR family transcriptional regulator [Lachnotalea glycerini]RDY28838.1 LytTR family transcriptional regulator [Lachnotalea glycerini]